MPISVGNISGQQPHPLGFNLQKEDECPVHIVHFLADPQYAIPSKYPKSPISNQAGDAFGPAARAPGQLLGAPAIHERLARGYYEALPASLKSTRCHRVAMLGDDIDLGDKDEWKIIDAIEKRLIAFADALRVVSRTPGNHGLGPSGLDIHTLSSSFLSWLMELEKVGENFARNIFYPSVGGLENAMDKEALLRLYYQRDQESFEPLLMREFDDEGFRIEGQHRRKWKEDEKRSSGLSEALYKSHWKESPGYNNNHGLYQAKLLIKYDPEGSDGLRENQRWLNLTITQVSDFDQGNVYLISADSMDSTADRNGNLPDLHNGRVSAMQVEEILLAMAHVKNKLDPKANFLLSMHHPGQDIRDYDSSGFEDLLKHNDVAGVVVGHSHTAAIHNLNEIMDLGLDRPVWQVTAPAIIDQRNGSLPMAIYQSGQKTYIKFHVNEIRMDKLPHYASIRPAFEFLKDFLLPQKSVYERVARYDQTMADFLIPPELPDKSDILEGLGTTILNYLKKLDIILDTENGIMSRADRVGTIIVANVLMPQLAEESHTYIKIFGALTKESLEELGLGQLSMKYQGIYGQLVEDLRELDSFYQSRRGDRQGFESPAWERFKANLKRCSEFKNELALTIQEAQKGGASFNKELLEATLKLVNESDDYLKHFGEWIKVVGKIGRLDLSLDHYKGHTGLFDHDAFKVLLHTAQVEMPYGSRAHSLLVMLGHESANQWYAWKHSRRIDQDLPGPLTIELGTHRYKKEETLNLPRSVDLEVPRSSNEFTNDPVGHLVLGAGLRSFEQGGYALKLVLGVDSMLFKPNHDFPYLPNAGLAAEISYSPLELDKHSFTGRASARVFDPTGRLGYGFSVYCGTQASRYDQWSEFACDIGHELLLFDHYRVNFDEQSTSFLFDAAGWFRQRKYIDWW